MKVGIHILSFNLMTPVLPPLRTYGQFERAQRVHEVIKKFPHLDVVVFNEINPTDIEALVDRQMKELGFVHRTNNISRLMSVNGGVLIFSRFPIMQTDFTSFGDKCAGFDCFSAKGMVYARVKKDQVFFNILGTHLQAGSSVEAQIIRDGQMNQMNQFIDWLQIPKTEPLIMVGDINMDLYKERDNLNHLMYQMHMELPIIHPDSHPLTIDPSNNKLVGVDDPTEYSSEDFPHGCVDEYFSTLRCPCCAEEWLDYVLFSSSHLKPYSSFLRADKVQVEPFTMNISMTQKITCQDVSDHYPLYSMMMFDFSSQSPEQPDRLTFKNGQRQDQGTDSAYKGWIISIGVLLLVLLILGLSMLYFWYRAYQKGLKDTRKVIKVSGSSPSNAFETIK